MNISDEIRKLHELHQGGALTDEEFAKAKAAILIALPRNNLPSPEAKVADKADAPMREVWPVKDSGVGIGEVIGGLLVGGLCGGVVAVVAVIAAKESATKMTDDQLTTVFVLSGFLGALIGAVGFTAGRLASWIAWFTFFGALAGAMAFGPIGPP